MACTLRSVVICGILLAVMDLLHGLATLGFYLYPFVREHFYVCPLNLDLKECNNANYYYEQIFERRVFIGMGEGIVGILFAVFYVVALVKHKPSLAWMWLLKSSAVIAINIYYLSSWYIRWGYYNHIDSDNFYQDIIFFAGICLTLAQFVIMVLHCIIGGIFTYKVAEERTASRRSLYHSRKGSSNDGTAPPNQYDNYVGQDLNLGLSNSEKTLPVRASKQSLTDLSREDTFKHSAGV